MHYAAIDLDDTETNAHLARHFAGSAEGGSKFDFAFDSEEGRALISAVDRYLRAHLDAVKQKGEKPGKLEVTLTLADLPLERDSAGAKALLKRQTLGTDAVVALSSVVASAAFKGLRDGQGEVQYLVDKELPRTDKLTLIAGAYGPSGLWGLETLFSGANAPALPSPQMDETLRTEAEAFWKKAAVVITPAEAAKLITGYDPLIKRAGDLENAYQETMLIHGAPKGQRGMEEATEERYRLYGFKRAAEAALAAFEKAPGRPAVQASEGPQRTLGQ